MRPLLPPRINCPPHRVRVLISVRVRFRVGGKFSAKAIVLRTVLPVETKEIFYMETKYWLHSFIICAKLHLFPYTKSNKWSKLDDVHVFET